MEGLWIYDEDKNQADAPAEYEAERNAQRSQQAAFCCQHTENLATRHADMAQYAELFSTRQSLCGEARRHTEQPDNYRDRFQQVSYRKAAVKNIQA